MEDSLENKNKSNTSTSSSNLRDKLRGKLSTNTGLDKAKTNESSSVSVSRKQTSSFLSNMRAKEWILFGVLYMWNVMSTKINNIHKSSLV